MTLTRSLTALMAVSLMAGCDQGASEVAPVTDQTEPAAPARAEVWPHPMDCAGDAPLTLAGYEPLDPMTYIDAPDSDAAEATEPLEIALLAQLARGEILALVVKRYCQMGVTRMVVEITHPAEDDAVIAVTLRAIYRWRAEEVGVGWQIAELGIRHHCARGRETEEGPCL